MDDFLAEWIALDAEAEALEAEDEPFRSEIDDNPEED